MTMQLRLKTHSTCRGLQLLCSLPGEHRSGKPSVLWSPRINSPWGSQERPVASTWAPEWPQLLGADVLGPHGLGSERPNSTLLLSFCTQRDWSILVGHCQRLSIAPCGDCGCPQQCHQHRQSIFGCHAGQSWTKNANHNPTQKVTERLVYLSGTLSKTVHCTVWRLPSQICCPNNVINIGKVFSDAMLARVGPKIQITIQHRRWQRDWSILVGHCQRLFIAPCGDCLLKLAAPTMSST